MKTNIGILDSIIRIAIGMIVIGVGLIYEAAWGLFGLLPIATFVFKWSIFYYVFGINTCERETKQFKVNA
jgi:hypothetical protein